MSKRKIDRKEALKLYESGKWTQRKLCERYDCAASSLYIALANAKEERRQRREEERRVTPLEFAEGHIAAFEQLSSSEEKLEDLYWIQGYLAALRQTNQITRDEEARLTRLLNEIAAEL